MSYKLADYEKHKRYITEIKEFMAFNKFVQYDESVFKTISDELEKAYSLSSFEEIIRTQIDDSKQSLDELFASNNRESQQKKSNFEKLLEYIKIYTRNLDAFNTLLTKIQSYELTIQSKEIESLGHKLFIEYTFKIDQEVFLKTINEFLKSEHKIDSLNALHPRELYLSNYKDRPKVDSYDDFKSKVYVKFEEMNTRKYRIITKNGKNFDSLSAGWKTSVLLDLILGYDGDTAPLIIDQPEDNLANSYINKGLIEAIKKIKEHKQIIIVSHNATIPMLGDAQNIILCRYNEKIKISSNPLEGNIDGKQVVDHIATITDGGKTSIKKRVKKYNMKKFEESL